LVFKIPLLKQAMIGIAVVLELATLTPLSWETQASTDSSCLRIRSSPVARNSLPEWRSSSRNASRTQKPKFLAACNLFVIFNQDQYGFYWLMFWT